jgi:hypothetical protein
MDPIRISACSIPGKNTTLRKDKQGNKRLGEKLQARDKNKEIGAKILEPGRRMHRQTSLYAFLCSVIPAKVGISSGRYRLFPA